MKKLYTIGQLAKLAGISTKTLRVYERKGLLVPERNAVNSYRLYGEEAVRTLEKIQLMKWLDFSLDQIAEFLTLYENVSREKMLLEQKRLLAKKRTQLNTVIAHVDRAVQECRLGEQDSNTFLKSLGSIVRNQRADELVGSLMRHSNEPWGWSRYIVDTVGLDADMRVLDAGAGWGNLWRCNEERLPEGLSITCVDRHNTHMDTFCAFLEEQKAEGKFADSKFDFVWDDLETMSFEKNYDRIFFNHTVSHIADRVALYHKFYDALAEEGILTCTWGGYLFYDNMQPYFREFFGGCPELEEGLKKHKKRTDAWEQELRDVFPAVENHAYIIHLHFATAEEFLDYILQVCKPVREVLEVRREEFLTYLRGKEELKNVQGGFEITRDTFLFTCTKER
jgi:DNA-binding transcriptional MerR regulator